MRRGVFLLQFIFIRKGANPFAPFPVLKARGIFQKCAVDNRVEDV